MVMEEQRRPTVAVVVLGDIGRSPRMRYHASSLIEEGFNVNLIGYGGSEIPELKKYPGRISVSYVKDYISVTAQGMSRIFLYFIKVFALTLSLAWALNWRRPPLCVLVQNPPSIPALPVLYLYCLVTKAHFFIDWHNYGHTILSLTLKPTHPLVSVCRWVEFHFGSRAVAGFCVTDAMRADLNNHGLERVATLYDLPSPAFKPISDEEKAKFLLRIGELYPKAFCCEDGGKKRVNRFAQLSEIGTAELKAERPGLVVSATSWTEDEDFQMFLTALETYDAQAVQNKVIAELVVVITGKGPLKRKFVEIIDSIPWRRIVIVTPWLSAEDYPRMLASSDLGVSLHSSSSGLDLPMKVVDMFGAGLPVAALDFSCLEELVVNDKNGIVFNNASELHAALVKWFKGPDFKNPNAGNTFHKTYRDNVKRFASRDWHSHWSDIALPEFKKFVSNP
ncbi:unnamed protein product [Notodromas monacha]|uniref:Chitobiosyldiphosphodolichol beta-mannosyltransferase n=1 Tax=Notodromas monacha TaxID=399045 RepID=A0A7R9GA38_9CRUS|nr:unnamed protein product [Notodromas monacha]CAG0913713.1 unnamed protein product [Notodromas monacha]